MVGEAVIGPDRAMARPRGRARFFADAAVVAFVVLFVLLAYTFLH